MTVRVEIPPPLRPHTDGLEIVEVDGATVEAVLQAVGERHPALAQRIFKNGKPSPNLNFYLNEEDIRYLDDLATAVKPGDTLLIQPPVAGG
jgi:molybdopterin converting factor small subunit